MTPDNIELDSRLSLLEQQLKDHLGQHAMTWLDKMTSGAVLIDRRQVEQWIDGPDWSEGGSVYNWRNYVPQTLKDHWPKLHREARAICIMMANNQAVQEDWD